MKQANTTTSKGEKKPSYEEVITNTKFQVAPPVKFVYDSDWFMTEERQKEFYEFLISGKEFKFIPGVDGISNKLRELRRRREMKLVFRREF